MNRLQTVGTIAVVVVALGLALVIQANPTGTSSTVGSSTSTSTGTSSTSSSVSTSTGSLGPDGLLLRLSVNSSSILVGRSLGLMVSEYNTHSSTNNVSAASQWVVQGSTGSCPIQFYPFGVSLFRGHYTAQNVTQGSPVQIFPVTPCPLFIRLITGFFFQPESVNAALLPGSVNVTTPMLTVLKVGQNYTSGGVSEQGTPLLPGSYTIVASDEWGNLAFLYATVQGLP